ncbi:Nucleosomal histone H3-Lys79 methylase [Blastocladiella emersonii ATCC 22665]|nr:Nucleosomal histone H3-Lys79 methylase [Blastocladiella emersonii ATCC 22665]
MTMSNPPSATTLTSPPPPSARSGSAGTGSVPVREHVRIRSRDAPPEDPFAFLFPNPRPHPVILDPASSNGPGSGSTEKRASSASAAGSGGGAVKRSSSDTVAPPSRTGEGSAAKRPRVHPPLPSNDAAQENRKRPASASASASASRGSPETTSKHARKPSTDSLRRADRVKAQSSPVAGGTSSAAEMTPPPQGLGTPTAGGVHIIHSADIVHSSVKNYKQWFLDADGREPADSLPTVELVYLTKNYRERELVAAAGPPGSAAGSGSSSISLAAARREVGEYDPVADLCETIRILVQHTLVCPSPAVMETFSDASMSNGLLRRLERARNYRSLNDFVSAVNDFNREYAKCKKDGYVLGYTKKRQAASSTSDDVRRAIQARLAEYTPADLVAHALYQAYARAVAPRADVLVKYEAFSNTVYGEINPNFVEMLIDNLGIRSNHTFIDLGSGIGNVVLQVAARTECSSYGIEIQPAAAELAQQQLDEFRARLKYLNRRIGHVELYEGDMLLHPSIPALVRKADVVFVNNYVFQPKLNRALLELFLDLKDGARVVSLREFAPVDNRITARNADSIEALFEVDANTYPSGFVSWTDQPGKWYVHTMNRLRVREYKEAHGLA